MDTKKFLQQHRALRISAEITTFLGIGAVLALIFLYLSLSDIGHNEPDTTLEWKIAGICMAELAAFIISTFVTIGLLLRYGSSHD